MFWNIAQVKEANKAIGHCWFSRDTMRFFASRVVSKLYYNTQTFISSEKRCFNDPVRVYKVRKVESNGAITTLSKDLPSIYAARQFIKDFEAQYEADITTSCNL